jgi:predicted MFS family arabinose efflux permease
MNILKLYKDSFSGINPQIWYLALVTLINRAGAMVLPFLSLYLTVEEGYSLSVTGSILMCFGIGSFFGNYIGGILTDKLGAFRLQFFSLVATSFAFFSLMYLHSPISMGLGLLATSLLADAFRPANMASVSILESQENRTKAVGIIRLAINLGFAAGPASGGMIAFSIGYEWLFMIDATTCMLAAFFLLFIFRKQIKAEGISKKEKNEKEIEKPSIGVVIKDKAFIGFLFLVFLIACVFMQFFNSLPVFFKQDLFLNENDIGLIMALNGTLVVILELPIIHLLKGRNELKLISLGCILLAICYAVLIFDSWVGISIVCVVFFTIGEILVLPYTTAAIMNRAPEHLRGRYLALYGMAFSLSHMLAPFIGMRIAESFGFGTLWISIALLILIPSFFIYKMKGSFKSSIIK